MLKREVGGFLLVGMLAAVFDFSTFNLLLAMGSSVAVSNVVALCISAVVGFFGNRQLSFRHRRKNKMLHSSLKFVLVSVATVVISQTATLFLISVMDANSVAMVNLAKVIVIGSMTVIRFALSKYFIFL